LIFPFLITSELNCQPPAINQRPSGNIHFPMDTFQQSTISFQKNIEKKLVKLRAERCQLSI